MESVRALEFPAGINWLQGGLPARLTLSSTSDGLGSYAFTFTSSVVLEA